PNPQVAMALSALKPVVVQVKPILTFHPSGAAENVQNRFPTHVKNFACGLGDRQLKKPEYSHLWMKDGRAAVAKNKL
ncbi:hypothetical protein, partial [Fretibacterium fastidiosum]